MTFGFRRARRDRPTAPAHARATVEPLEGRRLLSGSIAAAGPQVVGQQLIGPDNAVTAIRFTFDRPLNPVTAEDPDAYVVIRVVNHDGEQDDGGFFSVPFVDGSTDSKHEVRKLKIDSAAYDATTMSVTVTAHQPFIGDRRFRQVKVLASGQHAVTGADGVPLDGDGDGKSGDTWFMKFKARRRRTFAFKDADGDRATLRLSGPGTLVSLVRRKGTPAPIVFVLNGAAGRTVLSGTVKPGRRGDGVVDLQEFTGTSTAQVTFLTDPAFRIGLTQA